MEHTVLVVFVLIHCAVPRVPHKTKRAMELQRVQRPDLQPPSFVLAPVGLQAGGGSGPE